VIGFKRHLFSRGYWMYMDIDTAKAPKR
jgi:hypothetical protein